MRLKQSRYLSLFLLFCLLISGCVCTTNPESLVRPLPKLTTAIQGLVRFPINGEPPLTDEEMIQKVFDDKPELKEIFAGLPISIWHNDRYAIVLISSPKDGQAWLEDGSWTYDVDLLRYKDNPPQPSKFILINQVPEN